MLWEEDVDVENFSPTHDMLDLAFTIQCRCLPWDHAYLLSQAIHQVLPWFAEEEDAGLHLIRGAESGNGWQRTDEPGGIIYLSRRAKLVLRLPRSRIPQAQVLTGLSLQLAEYELLIGKLTEKPLSAHEVMFAHYVTAPEQQSEETFIEDCLLQLRQLNIRCRKMLCGKTTVFSTPSGKLFTRSLMIADLLPEDAVKLQQKGLGEKRKMGCGLFVPHKGIRPVDEARNRK